MITDQTPHCPGCGFSIRDLERQLSDHPQRQGFVNDFATLLTTEEAARLEGRLAQFQQQYGGEIVVTTVPSTQPLKPSEYVFWLFNHWQVGGEAHSGLMILLAIQEHRIECEVGYSWEPVISDLESGQVLDECVVPLLQEGKVAEALWKGVAELAGILETASASSTNPQITDERGTT
jgi:uncharacterized protein